VKSYDAELLQLKSLIRDMGKSTRDQISRAFEGLITRNNELVKGIDQLDDTLDQMQNDVDELTIRMLAKRQPMAIDLRMVFSGQKIAGNLERIGDHGKNIASYAEVLNRHSQAFPMDSIEQMGQIILQMIESAMKAYHTGDTELAVKVWHQDDDLDAAYTKMLEELWELMGRNPDNVKAGTTLLLIARCAERIGDLITNIAESVYYITHGKIYRGQLG
jgi:phosphate transport system protein